MCPGRPKTCAYYQGHSQDFWQGALSEATCFASEAVDRATAVVRDAKPLENYQDFMLNLDPESTCKGNCNKESNSHSGCKNEQQADFEVQLENRISITRN